MARSRETVPSSNLLTIRKSLDMCVCISVLGAKSHHLPFSLRISKHCCHSFWFDLIFGGAGDTLKKSTQFFDVQPEPAAIRELLSVSRERECIPLLLAAVSGARSRSMLMGKFGDKQCQLVVFIQSVPASNDKLLRTLLYVISCYRQTHSISRFSTIFFVERRSESISEQWARERARANGRDGAIRRDNRGTRRMNQPNI